jgi:hypothetical protein
MKRVLFAGAGLLASFTAAQAIQCVAEPPADRSGSWYWRTIEGRKCWYQGSGLIPKSELTWNSPSLADAQASMTAAAPIANLLPPPQQSDDPDDGSFASRWRGLEAKP